jgi:F-type H+-transporting ATPase subunit delta
VIDEADGTTMQNILAARYARALVEALREKAAVEKCGLELELLAQAFEESKPFRDFFLNPGCPETGKAEALAAIIKKGNFSAATGRLLKILLQKRRIALLPDISVEFRRIEEKTLNRVSVEVTTAVPLPPAVRKKLSDSLERLTGKSVRLESKVDPAVLGGARARIGSVIYDGTVSGRLQKLKRQLIGER